MVCGRPTGMPMSSITVRQVPDASFICSDGGLIDSDELQPIHEHRFFELVCHADFISAVSRPKLVAANAYVFVRVGLIPARGRDPVAHLTTAHEVGHELESRPVPREQIRT